MQMPTAQRCMFQIAEMLGHFNEWVAGEHANHKATKKDCEEQYRDNWGPEWFAIKVDTPALPAPPQYPLLPSPSA